MCFGCSKEPSHRDGSSEYPQHVLVDRDQGRGQLGRNSRPRGQNFALNGTQGEVGVSLKKKGETHFHSVTTQMQAVVT